MRALALAHRLLRQFGRDKRTLAMIFVAPVLVLALLSLIFKSDEYRPRLAAVSLPPALVTELTREAREVRVRTPAEALLDLRERRVDAVISLASGRPSVHVEGSDPTVTRAVLGAVQRASASIAGPTRPTAPEVRFLHGSATLTAFDNFGPVLLGFLVFFFVYLVAGISFVRERTTGTLERMLASPLRRWEVVVGYVLGFAAVVVVQAALIALVSVYALHMTLAGSFAYLLLIVLLLAAAALTLGMLLSAFARTEFQMIQFIPLVVLPQVFFSGLFNLEAMTPWLRSLGEALPLTWGARAMRAVMIRGGGIGEIGRDLALLAAFSAGAMALNVFALRKYRAI